MFIFDQLRFVVAQHQQLSQAELRGQFIFLTVDDDVQILKEATAKRVALTWTVTV